MLKFEYDIIECIHPTEFKTLLNSMGSFGWELVHTEHLVAKVGVLCIFKRRIK